MSKYRITVEIGCPDEERKIEERIRRYTQLCRRYSEILVNSGVNWKPEYEQEMSLLREELQKEKSELNELIEKFNRRRVK